MTITYIQNKINQIMKEIQDIDITDLSKRKYNQIQINVAYRLLDNLKDELIRERIKNKQKGGTNENSNNNKE